jgi:anaerobic selenocysteine-containing dehydrogenase
LRAVHRPLLLAAALALAGLTAATASPADIDTRAAKNQRFKTCMVVASGCGHRVEEGDIPYARLKDRRGGSPRVRTCIRDRDGKYCLPRERPGAGGRLVQPVLYRNTGRQKTTWRVNGKVVGSWRWRVQPK